MPRVPAVQEASRDALDPLALRDLRFVEEVLAWRDGAVERLYGTRRRRDPLRDAILRRSVICLGEGKFKPIGHYQRQCATLGSRTAIRGMVQDLEGHGLVVLRPERKGRTIVVVPTERVVRWYAASIKELRKIIARRLRDDPEAAQALGARPTP